MKPFDTNGTKLFSIGIILRSLRNTDINRLGLRSNIPYKSFAEQHIFVAIKGAFVDLDRFIPFSKRKPLAFAFCWENFKHLLFDERELHWSLTLFTSDHDA